MHFRCIYVWRGAHDSHILLIQVFTPIPPTTTQLDSFQRAASSRSTGKFAFFAKRKTPAGDDVEVPITLDEMLVYSTVRGGSMGGSMGRSSMQ